MKKAVMIGGGNIGRGFIGAVLAEAGYHITFADINQELIENINKLGKYTVNIVDDVCSQQVVTNISAVDSTSQDMVDEITTASLVTTAVGLTVLPHIAEAVANGIDARMEAGCEEYLNIIACENAIRASSQLKALVYKHMDRQARRYADKYVGFPDCTVDIIIPQLKAAAESPLDVTVEDYHEWSVERSAFKGEIPEIPAMDVVDDVMAYLERKLFTLNTGHCVTAYLGSIKGYETVGEAILDPKICAIAKGAMIESGKGLIVKHGFVEEEHWAYVDKCLDRFDNPYLKDELVRVGRQPFRKLAADDRLVGPLMNAREHGFDTENLIKAIGAALHFCNEADEQSLELQQKIADKGVIATVTELTGITNLVLLADIVKAYATIGEEIQ